MRIFGQTYFSKRLFGIILFFLLGGTAGGNKGTEALAAENEISVTERDGGPGQVTEVPKASNPAPDNRDEIIKNLIKRVEMLEKGIRPLRGPSEKTSLPSEVLPAVPPVNAEDEERLAQAALERTLIERSGILLPPWTLEIEPSLTYAHASADNISIDGVSVESTLVIGEIISDRVRRNILIPALSLRLGLPKDFQAEAKFPLRFETERTVRGDATERIDEDFGVGDIELALSHQLMREKGWVPDILGSMRWKSDTGHSPFSLAGNEVALGTGYHALQFMLTAVKVKEPAAFFGSLLYTLNFPASKLEGDFNPADVYGLNLGMALALNLDTSVNLIWEQRFTDRSELNGVKIPGSAQYPGNLRAGATYTFTPTVSMDVSVAIGLTRDAPDVQAIVAIPIRFPQIFSRPNK